MAGDRGFVIVVSEFDIAYDELFMPIGVDSIKAVLINGRFVDDGEIAAAPEAGPDSQQDEIEAATEAMKTFAQPQLRADDYWAQMLPLLSQQGGVAYEGTDPAQIPAHQVTGAGIVLADSTDVSLIVQVPTDVGPYNITLTRPNASAPWLADRIRPAQG